MEDKWFIFFEEPWLYLHRSWSGACIYAARFAPMGGGVTAAEAWVNRKRSEYKGTDNGYDTALLRFLIEALLLGKEVRFPVPTGEAYAPGVLQANIVGRAYPEISYSLRSDQRRFWTWLKGWF